jgi:hypothetical protein
MHPPEERVCRFTADFGQMFPEQLGEGRRAGHRPTFTFRTVLETTIVAARAVVGPLLADVRLGLAEVEFSPLTTAISVAWCI